MWTEFKTGNPNYEASDIVRYTMEGTVDDLADKTLDVFDHLDKNGYNIPSLTPKR
jgi:hypothetical protein